MTKEIFPKDTGKPQKNQKSTRLYDAESADASLNALNGIGFDQLFPPLPESSSILIGTGRDDFMASRIAHAVEDVDANLLNMNVTALNNPDNRHLIHLRISHRSPERVARSLERYGYNVLWLSEDELVSGELTLRRDELMHYLSI